MNNYLTVFAPRSPNIGNLVQGEHPKIRVEWGGVAVFSSKTCNISEPETAQDRTKVTIELMTNNYEVEYALSIFNKAT